MLGLGRRAHRIEAEDRPFRPVAELGQPRIVDAEDAGDGDDRNGNGDIGDQVEARPPGDRVQRLRDDRVDLRPRLGDAGIQRLGERRADARMVGIVHRQDRLPLAGRQLHLFVLQQEARERTFLGVDAVAP